MHIHVEIWVGSDNVKSIPHVLIVLGFRFIVQMIRVVDQLYRKFALIHEK